MKARIVDETDEILNTGLGGGLPYLGAPHVVDGILREYILDLTQARSDQVQHGADPVANVDALAHGLQAVFYGQDRQFRASAWNRPESLGHALVHACGIGGDEADAVYRLGLRIAKEYLADLVAHEAGRLDDEGIHASIDEIMRRYTLILTGASLLGEKSVS